MDPVQLDSQGRRAIARAKALAAGILCFIVAGHPFAMHPGKWFGEHTAVLAVESLHPTFAAWKAAQSTPCAGSLASAAA
jgi:hypothetical protein